MSALDSYVGIPFAERGRTRAGCDCWGLVRLVYAERLGIELPSYAEYATTADHAEVRRLIEGGLADWRQVDKAVARPFDAVLMTEAGEPHHVGVVERPGFVLHAARDADSVIEPVSSVYLRRRIAGYFRHASQI